MALTTCPDCGSEVSDQADACPKCGRALKSKQAVTLGTIATALVILYFAARFLGWL